MTEMFRFISNNHQCEIERLIYIFHLWRSARSCEKQPTYSNNNLTKTWEAREREKKNCEDGYWSVPPPFFYSIIKKWCSGNNIIHFKRKINGSQFFCRHKNVLDVWIGWLGEKLKFIIYFLFKFLVFLCLISNSSRGVCVCVYEKSEALMYHHIPVFNNPWLCCVAIKY